MSDSASDVFFYRLADPHNDSEIATYKLQRILFCSRGAVESAERNCFAFTCSHGDNADTAMFQCHVFRCDLSDAVSCSSSPVT